MIGFVRTGALIKKCLDYCLSDKKNLSEHQKLELSLAENVQHFDRAEILEYNLCFGNHKEVFQQFNDVAKLNRRVQNPVFHFSLRLAPGEEMNKTQLIEIGRECAKEFDVSDHQYVTVLHKDTREQHIHIVANRVGFNGECASDSNSYKRMAALCRRLEKQYGLREVLSPRRFLPKDQRQLPRFDSRKEKLKTDIRKTLQQVNTYDHFEEVMKSLGYQVLKGRGITFSDNKNVRIKGSEVGFSLATIERALELKQKIASVPVEEKHRVHEVQQAISIRPKSTTQQFLQKSFIERQLEFLEQSAYHKFQQDLLNILFPSQQPEHYEHSLNPHLLRELKRKKKKKRPKW